MNNSFVAIDIETANEARSSICQIAIAVVNDGVLVKTKDWYVKPRENRFAEINTFIHGITWEKVMNERTFPEVWVEVLPEIEGYLILAHNVSFDMNALRDALVQYELPLPQFNYYCTMLHCKRTLTLPKYNLPSVCKHFEIVLDHHHSAGYDAFACAQLGLCLKFDEQYIRPFGLELNHWPVNSFASPNNGGNSMITGTIDLNPSERRKFFKPLRPADLTGIEIFDLSAVVSFETFKDKNVVVTGVFMKISRAEVEDHVCKLGAKLSGINKKTSLVIMGGEPGPSKIDKLKELNKSIFIPVIDETEFLETLEALAINN